MLFHDDNPNFDGTVPDYSLEHLQEKFQHKDLESLYRRYEQRAQLGNMSTN